MGVKDLWKIVEETKEIQSWERLAGKVLAIDLSIWICESEGIRGMQGKVIKPHLRYCSYEYVVRTVFIQQHTSGKFNDLRLVLELCSFEWSTFCSATSKWFSLSTVKRPS